ncbi:hypothetical protein IFM89_039642 [Coptis chinensis]|uniref:VQ domain-containing protein n=1 Tax=Coptis chinensis TaxID=261450 RepID=A0A835LAF5_9MAGN|nr:hypothetical protein IFM89_039642 [Coptis chinensis]
MEKPACSNAQASTPLTTFVEADTKSFRELVQQLTGPSGADPDRKTQWAAEAASKEEAANLQVVGCKRPKSKLHERRQYTRTKLEIEKLGIHLFRPGSHTMESEYSTSPLGTPSKPFSKLSILEDEKDKREVPDLNRDEEEKAIKERRFYLHPSPRSRPGNGEPKLLTLFPLTSPKTQES